ncbi:ABC transporter ATP-binding protein [Peristeroidobacter soli]|uniref:ABC transporter ATP-binding protein n=1 Tax=Peristeroidobacter soli TaxID=2497877 RepID=UPI00101C0E9D|nr:dipeptide ABC transporter ATP-binding protein [Peristeroidobacter soli]
MTAPLLELEKLSVRFGDTVAVRDLSLAVQAGERVALVGESGSGKTVTALSVLRLLEEASISGAIRFQGEDLSRYDDEQIRTLRGRDISMIFQEPMSALNPVLTIGKQIIETLVLHEGLSARRAREAAISLLESTGVADPARRVDSYPHQLSGGQRQRAMIAMALACKPRLLIADEPTTALDVTIRARIVELLLKLQQRDGLAVLLITHDLHLVRKFAQRVAVMEQGVLVEVAPTEQLFEAPKHPYTRRLMDSQPVRAVTPVEASEPTVLKASGLRVEFKHRRGGWRERFRRNTLAAVDGVDFQLRRGETLGVLGESGSGKSTLALAVLGLVRPAAGTVEYDGRGVKYASNAWRAMRGQLQVVFQDPFGSLSPRMTVEQIIGEGLELHRPELTAAQRRAALIEVLGEVGLPESALSRYPHEFSGGQRQRIAIARAVVLKPLIVVLDEPTSALDVSIQRQVLALLTRLQRRYQLSYILITHDIAVANAMSHHLLVMKDGKVVETGETQQLLGSPRHTYTQSLLRAAQ